MNRASHGEAHRGLGRLGELVVEVFTHPFTWLRREIKAARLEADEIRRLPIRSWLHGKRWPGIALVLLAAALVAGKNFSIGLLPDNIGSDSAWALFARNGVAVCSVLLVTSIAIRSGWLLALGLPRSGAAAAWVQATIALGSAVISVVVSDRAPLGVTLIALTAATLLALWHRTRHGKDEEALWAVTPACLVLVVIAFMRLFRNDAGLELGRLAVVAVGTGLFEELIFRGGLLSLAIRTSHWFIRILVPGFAFGTWHIIDGIRDAQGRSMEFAVLVVAGTVLAMALASWFFLEPLRLRSRSILGPALLHAAINCGLLALGLESAIG